MTQPIFLADTDLRALAEARALLERPSLAARLSNFIGSPLEKGMARLPASWRERIGGLAHDALMKAMDTAAKTLEPAPREASPRLHKLLGSVSGAGGGAGRRCTARSAASARRSCQGKPKPGSPTP